MPSSTFPRCLRLSDKQAISLLFQNGSFFRLGCFSAKCRLTQHPHSRFLITASKASGNSPQRNRFKRLIREAIRLNQHRLQQSYDICVFIKKKPTFALTLHFVERQILWLFDKLNAF